MDPLEASPTIHHVMVAIPPGGDEAARSFYVQQLGLVEIAKPSELASRGGLWVSTGSIDLHIGIDPNFVPARKAHIALLVDDLERVREHFDSCGVGAGPIEFELTGFRRCYLDDPFGNRIELMQAL